jgi:hypothetical protein
MRFGRGFPRSTVFDAFRLTPPRQEFRGACFYARQVALTTIGEAQNNRGAISRHTSSKGLAEHLQGIWNRRMRYR